MTRNLILVFLALLGTAAAAHELPRSARDAASHAVERYDAEQVNLLSELVRFKTVHREGLANADNPEFRAFANHLRQQADSFGLDFTDLGAVLIIGLGESDERLGIVTHGDVQPADPSKWRVSPFELDIESEPGRLIARGTEDNKAPIATALYAMKTLRELELPLNRRIELIVSLTEESDWAPFREVLEHWEPPPINVAIDSEYPVVVAEKGWGAVKVTFENPPENGHDGPTVTGYDGGAFISQVPEDGRIRVTGVDESFVERVRGRADALPEDVRVAMEHENGDLTINVKGRAAHSMAPEEGVNALAYAATLLNGEELGPSAAGRAVTFVNSLIGTGVYGRQFGNAAYEHPFMGPLTVNLSTARTGEEGVEIAINLRAPAGKSADRLESDLRQAIANWASDRGVPAPAIEASLSEAYYPEQPPQVGPLLAVYRHYTGDVDAKPISIGGGTNARLLPNGVNFGPSMPDEAYTGHSEHEFVTREQLTLNLRMYTAMMAILAAGRQGQELTPQ